MQSKLEKFCSKSAFAAAKTLYWIIALEFLALVLSFVNITEPFFITKQAFWVVFFIWLVNFSVLIGFYIKDKINRRR